MATDETLAWEARQRPRAAIAAASASLLILGSFVATGATFSDAPRGAMLTSLQRAAEDGPIGEAQSSRIPFFQYYSDHALELTGGSAARAIGYLLVGLALTFLAFASRTRMPGYPRLALYSPIVGGVLTAISYLLAPVATTIAVNDFLDGPRTVDAASEVARTSLVLTSQLIGFVGGLAVAMGLVFVSLYAMRVGLLTRFMGVLGILAGALSFIPLSPVPVVQCFWLAALAMLFLGRWPRGEPPAWATGEAQPWPTQQQIREARTTAAEGTPARDDDGGGEEPVAVGAPRAAQGPSHPVSKKKKRKRRG